MGLPYSLPLRFRMGITAGGRFICSGIIDPNRDLVAAEMRDVGFEVLEIRQKEGWVAVAGKMA